MAFLGRGDVYPVFFYRFFVFWCEYQTCASRDQEASKMKDDLEA
jgi:hypothetical protein